MERTKMPNLRNGSKWDSNPGSLDCESGILPQRQRAPHRHPCKAVEGCGCEIIKMSMGWCQRICQHKTWAERWTKPLVISQQLRATTKSLTFPILSVARYSFIQLSQLGRQWRERKCPIFETEAKEIRTRAHLIASSAFYCRDTALHDDIPVKLLKGGDVK